VPSRWRFRAGRQLAPLAAAVGLVVASALVWQSTHAAFTGRSVNPNNSWTASRVTLTEDSSATALFSVANLKPGDTGSRCILLTYGGDVAGTVKLYASAPGALGTYLDLTVERGSGGGFSSCTGFTPAATAYTGTLSGLASTATGYASGVGSYVLTGNGATVAYRISYTVQDTTSAQGTSVTAAFTWEVQNN
jgi:hypothetical protein